MKLTLNNLKDFIVYDPDTGILSWKVDYKSVKAGNPIGSLHHSGYLVCKIDGVQYLVHRLIWFFVTGKWPLVQIDHDDTIKTNNRWLNLREAIHNENQRNKNLQSNNTSGYKGVSWNKRKQKWIAQIKVNGKSLHLGEFDDIQDAIGMRIMAGEIHHEKFNRT